MEGTRRRVAAGAEGGSAAPGGRGPAPPPPQTALPEPGLALMEAALTGIARLERKLALSEERVAAALDRLATAEEIRRSERRGRDGGWSWLAVALVLSLLCYGVFRVICGPSRAEALPPTTFVMASPPVSTLAGTVAPPTPLLFSASAPASFLQNYSLGRA